jgi:predicted house-cleaning NTP pyrophosphatase (Maf/HAM1 superfamily)
MEAANDTRTAAKPLDEDRARKNIAKMMDTELGVNTAHSFQLGAVLALAYKHSRILFIRAPGDGKSARKTAET